MKGISDYGACEGHIQGTDHIPIDIRKKLGVKEGDKILFFSEQMDRMMRYVFEEHIRS